MENPAISIITVGMNHLNYIKELYQSLFDSRTKPQTSIEAIYVDNCSTDGSVEYLNAHYPQVKIIKNKKPYGFGKNNNIGVRVAKGKYIAIINPDIRIKTGSLDQLYNFMESHSNVGMTVPKLYNVDGSHQYSIRGFITPSLFISRILTHGNDSANNNKMRKYLCKDIDIDKVQPVNWAVGAALFISSNLYRELGGFDLDYFLYMEDEDLALRVWKSGHPVIYVPSAHMVHNHLRASSHIGKKAWIHFKSLLTFFRKHGLQIPDYAEKYNEKYY